MYDGKPRGVIIVEGYGRGGGRELWEECVGVGNSVRFSLCLLPHMLWHRLDVTGTRQA